MSARKLKQSYMCMFLGRREHIEKLGVFINAKTCTVLRDGRAVANYVLLRNACLCITLSRGQRSRQADYIHVHSIQINEPRREKTGFLHMRKQRRRSASR